MNRALRRLALVIAAAAAVGCASGGVRLPAGPGASFPDFAAFHGEAMATCASVNSLSLAMSLSGRTGGQRIRGTVHAGLSSPGAIRLEALAPFGGPVFVFVARPGVSTLLWTREDRVLTGADPAEVVEAITGVRLSPDDLLAILSGCVTRTDRPVAGHAHGERWRTVDLDDGTSLYFRREGAAWPLVAAVRDTLRVDYTGRLGSGPRTIRLRTGGAGTVVADLKLSVTEVDANADLGAEVFAVAVPESAVPMTLDELRRRGPLGEQAVREPSSP